MSVTARTQAARARAVALAVPLALLGGALLSEHVGGLWPCEMCWWQRYPHAVAILLSAAAFTAPAETTRSRTLTLLAALAIAISGAIGVMHVGVEQGWWEGITTCTTSGATSLEDIMQVPLVRCDEVQWSLFGISLAGFNAIFSLGGAALVAVLLGKARKAAR
ncbi:disulfide bond formation protein B [Sphingomonas rhizophila]|uniref:Disulfide bond formation protein B n=1 Tax=Sphingomonas rhizophila TaxID=2071607 RepID=A0A7G9S9M8_9SPHN|nr:disulfide bond formation protein B [Sphingomonas rhizophila]QNN64553.1 disulfide bond formation protein B [Sphingomonas rhizophila]